ALGRTLQLLPPMIRTALAAALLLSALALGGCDAFEAQDAFEDDASEPPSGIFRTDDGVTPLGGENDPDDWRTAPLYATSLFSVTLRPFPNPVSFSGGETVTLQVTTGDAIPRSEEHTSELQSRENLV